MRRTCIAAALALLLCATPASAQSYPPEPSIDDGPRLVEGGVVYVAGGKRARLVLARGGRRRVLARGRLANVHNRRRFDHAGMAFFLAGRKLILTESWWQTRTLPLSPLSEGSSASHGPFADPRRHILCRSRNRNRAVGVQASVDGVVATACKGRLLLRDLRRPRRYATQRQWGTDPLLSPPLAAAVVPMPEGSTTAWQVRDLRSNSDIALIPTGGSTTSGAKLLSDGSVLSTGNQPDNCAQTLARMRAGVDPELIAKEVCGRIGAAGTRFAYVVAADGGHHLHVRDTNGVDVIVAHLGDWNYELGSRPDIDLRGGYVAFHAQACGRVYAVRHRIADPTLHLNRACPSLSASARRRAAAG